MLRFPVLPLFPKAIHQSASWKEGKTCSKSSASRGLHWEECDIHGGSFFPVSQGFISTYFYMFSCHYLLLSPRLPAIPHKGLHIYSMPIISVGHIGPTCENKNVKPISLPSDPTTIHISLVIVLNSESASSQHFIHIMFD